MKALLTAQTAIGSFSLKEHAVRDHKAAFSSKQRALAIRLKVFGEQYESTAYSYRQLGVT